MLSVGLQHQFQERDKRFGSPYVIAADPYFPEARKTTKSGDGTRL